MEKYKIQAFSLRFVEMLFSDIVYDYARMFGYSQNLLLKNVKIIRKIEKAPNRRCSIDQHHRHFNKFNSCAKPLGFEC